MGQDSNLAKHYIHNDVQLAHLNSGFPLPNGDIVYITLMQGRLGCLTRKSEGSSIPLEGYLGCHGARCTDDGKEIYFVHSPFGDLIFTDKNGKIKSKFHFQSIWLYDVQQISPTDCFLMSDPENNKLLVYDGVAKKIVSDLQFKDEGTIQFLHARPIVEAK